MSGKCGLYPFKGEFSSIEGEVSTTCSRRKKRQSNKENHSSVRNGSAIAESKGKCKLAYGGESENTWDSMKNASSSLEFPSRSQEMLRQIYQQAGEMHRQDSLNFEEESEESDEDDVLTLEQLRETEEYKLMIKGLDAKLGNPQEKLKEICASGYEDDGLTEKELKETEG
ncbi:hypothetical protein ABFA07_000952 [Porites harrisoni]|mmetsp:Transcript_85046/g.134693  ORF Transcript_85046/g.134693 Transcript_85046/m.134693 type:complete len:170 (+) Transcript_85046:71-580(+)